MSDLRGEAVVITGAGQGLGAAYARAAGALGARVVVNDIDAEKAEGVASQIREAGGFAFAEPQDVCRPEGAQAVVDRCIAEFGEITGLVNNAGVFIQRSFAETTLDELRTLLEVNVIGVFNCAKAAWEPMLRQGRGSIVNVTSGAQTGQIGRSCYGATKGAVASFTYAWSAELEGTGVRVNAISPYAATAMSVGIPGEHPSADMNAPVVMFLLSAHAKEVTGQVLRIVGTRLSLMSHPAVRTPVLKSEDWTLDSVAEAFRTKLAGNQLPIDVATYDITTVRT